MPNDLQALATRKYGPLPAWGWGGIFVVMVGGFWYLRRRGGLGGGGGSDDSGQSIAYVQPNDMLSPFNLGGGGGGGGSTDTPNGVGTPAGNAPSTAPPSWMDDILLGLTDAIARLATITIPTNNPSVPPVSATPSTPTPPGSTILFDAGPGNTGGGQINTVPSAPTGVSTLSTPEIEPGHWLGLGEPVNTGYVNRSGDYIPPAVTIGARPANVPAGALPTEAGTWAIPPTTVNTPPVQSGLVTLGPGESHAYVTNRSSGIVGVRPMSVQMSAADRIATFGYDTFTAPKPVPAGGIPTEAG